MLGRADLSILQNIHGHDDLIHLTDEERKHLCEEIREFLVSHVSKTGGHLASNLGAVELTVAIETVFNTNIDRLVFDVGHQSYVHKLLTGRQADFEHLRQFGGMAGFPKPTESDADAFVAGHASSSVSIALGMARARTLLGQNYDVVTLLGDGAATGGMVYEGLNDAAVSREPMIIILNDNEMSIDQNVGGMSRHLSLLRTKEQYLGAKKRYRTFMRKFPGGNAVYHFTKRIKDRLKRFLLPTTIFENMGLAYLGPVDGHDLPGLISLLRTARDMRVPVILHVVTKKGCGYLPAEEDPSRFHGIGKFEPCSGKKLGSSAPNYSDVFGQTLVDLAQNHPNLCAITAAMPSGTGLQIFKQKYPKRTFDVGIAEEHAVSMAGGLAKQGMIPVVAIYSTFLQRGFDQIMQDVALLGLHVVFAVDRAGLVGEDGPTHHGVFDVGYLRQIPNMTVLCPANFQQLQEMLRWAVEECTGPVAVRYPRGGTQVEIKSDGDFTVDQVSCLHSGEDVTLVSYGTLLKEVSLAASILSEKNIHARVLQLHSVTDYSVQSLAGQIRGKHLFIIEEAAAGSGIKETVSWQVRESGFAGTVHGLDLGDQFVPHGSIMELYRLAGIDADSIVKKVQEALSNEE